MTHDSDRFVSFVRRHISDSLIKTVFELGSRDGDTAVEFATHYPDAKIFTFECNPNSIDSIKSRISNYDNITLVPSAVFDKEQEIDFYPCTTNVGASSIFAKSGKYDYIENYVQSHTTVRAIRLDNFIQQYSIDEVDLVFADLQGAELAALIGMGEYIRNVKAIQTEVEYEEMYAGQPLYNDVYKFLTQNNFTEVWKAKYHNDFWGEAIFINKQYLTD